GWSAPPASALPGLRIETWGTQNHDERYFEARAPPLKGVFLYSHTETVTVWLYLSKIPWLKALGPLQPYRQKTRKDFLHFSASQQGCGLQKIAARLRARDAELYLAIDKLFCAKQ